MYLIKSKANFAEPKIRQQKDELYIQFKKYYKLNG